MKNYKVKNHRILRTLGGVENARPFVRRYTHLNTTEF
jgi:hypothetical protein